MLFKRSNPDFLNGIPELLLLRPLLSEKPMYGYELVQAIKQATGGRLAFGEGCIYSILHKLEADKSIAGQRSLVAGRSRVVYRVLPRGRKKFAASFESWNQVVSAVTQAVKGGPNANPTVA